MIEAIQEVWPLFIPLAILWAYVWWEDYQERKKRIKAARDIERELMWEAQQESAKQRRIIQQTNDRKFAKTFGNSR